MRKILVLYLALVMLLGLFMIYPGDEIATADDTNNEFREIDTYMFGESESERTLNLTEPRSDEDQTVACDSGHEQFQNWEVGTWESEAMKKRTGVRNNGIMNFTIWAQGDVSDVQFTIDLDLGGGNGGSFTTERKNLVEDTPIEFRASGTVQGNNHAMNPGETFSVTITYDGQELPGTGGDNHAEIVFGSKDYPAGLTLEMNTIFFENVDYEITDSNDEEHPDSIIWDVNLHRSFDIMDVVVLQGSVHGPKDGTSITLSSDHVDDVTEITMIWEFGKDSAWTGTYTFNVSVIDYNNNQWWITENFDLIVVGSPDIDFILGDVNIMSNSDKPYKDQAVTINATIEAVGDPSAKGLRPVAYLQIFNSSGELVNEDYNTIAIDTYAVKPLTFYWTVPEIDTYTVKLWIDYLEGEENGVYRENNDQGTGEDNNYGEVTFQSFKAGKSDSGDDEWYEDTDILAMIGGSSAAVVVAVVVVFLLVRRKRRADEEGEEFEDEEDEDEEIYEF